MHECMMVCANMYMLTYLHIHMCTSDSQKRTVGMGARAGLLSLLKIVVGTDHGKRGPSPLEAFWATGIEDGGFC